MGAGEELPRAGLPPDLIDTHCHPDLEPLAGQLPQVMAAAHRAGVTCCVVPGVHPDAWDGMARIAADYVGVFPAFGIHPMHAGLADATALSRLAARAPTGVAIGEIGLDPAYPVPLERQERAFRDQLRLAADLGLPVLIHCRRAFQRTLLILREERAVRAGGIMHAFSGSPEMAREFIRLGFAISVSGMVTRDDALRPVRLVREIPLEQLVLETDAPDLTPQRYRGAPNQPAYLVETLLAVARIKGVAPEEVARACRARTVAVLPGLLR